MKQEERQNLIAAGRSLAEILGRAFAAEKSPTEAGIRSHITNILLNTQAFGMKVLNPDSEIFAADPSVAKKASELRARKEALEAELAGVKESLKALDSGKSVEEAAVEEIVLLAGRMNAAPHQRIPGASIPWMTVLGEALYRDVFPNGIPESKRGRKPRAKKEGEEAPKKEPKK